MAKNGWLFEEPPQMQDRNDLTKIIKIIIKAIQALLLFRRACIIQLDKVSYIVMSNIVTNINR